VYTPFELARAMVAALHKNGDQTWLEPCVGRGVFLRVLRENSVSRRNVVAVDLDPAPAIYDDLARVIRGMDFLQWSGRTRRRFDCVVANPPFISIRTLEWPLRETAAGVLDHLGQPVGLSANTWYAFLLRSVGLLRRHGSLAFVLPAACEYADYSRRGREAITGLFDRTDLIRSRRPLFPGVKEGAAILVCRGKGGKGRLYRRHEVESLDDVVERLRELDNRQARSCPNGCRNASEQNDVRLGDVLEISIGGVTGDAKYFILTESLRKSLGLPVASLRPVVSRSRHVRQATVNSVGWESMRLAGERVWLFDPPPAVVNRPAVKRYLQLKAREGGCQRSAHKIRNRKPWYRTPLPSLPDGFISGMTEVGVWLCMNEMPRLSATNTLYVGHFRRKLSRAERYAWALAILTTPVARQIRRATRIYADGLQKIEPGQLAGVHVPQPPSIPNSVTLYRRALQHLLDGDESKCRALADRVVLRTELSQ
jgi:hypothetical protein